MATSPYAVDFASPRRDSFTPVATTAKGAVTWAHDLGLAPAGRPRLYVWGPNLVAAAGTSFAMYSPAGARLWTGEKEANSPVALANDRAYVESAGCWLEAFDATGKKTLEEAPLPGVASTEVTVVMLWPREQDFVTTLYVADPKFDSEGPDGKVTQPVISGRRAIYDQVLGAWGVELVGRMTLPALFIPESEQWIVAQQKVTCVGLGRAGGGGSFAIPIMQPLNWSANAAGELVVYGVHEEHKAVVALGLDGKARWRWDDANPLDAWVDAQPPIRGPEGRVSVLTTKRVIALDAGKVAWQFASPDGAPTWATALADGALLFTAGDTLRCLDAGGKPRFAVKVPAAIVSPPVVGAGGAIYVATATQLVRID